MAPLLDHNDFNGLSSDLSCNGFAPELHDQKIGEFKLEPIAVVGFSLKFPQDAVSPDLFWKMITEKRCAMTEFPTDRISLNAFYHADGERSDTIPVRGGHFLSEDPGVFDAPFFSITTAEAVSMDPQQRGLLETAYRALENAGIPLEKVFGSKTSVYTGSFADDYKTVVTKDPDWLPKYAATGLAMSLLANRLSWFFNLSGPSVNLDSACSSSMMGLDLACQGLRNGDSKMALVAGSSSIIGPELFLTLSNMGFLSPDSRCFSFDHRANGYGRGEGFGVVVIKLLSEAIRDGDTIRAVIRSTGSNHDGRTPGITQPSRDAQELLIKETYDKAGLDLRTTRFFEAHGTGTAVGDPNEASAIGGVFREYRSLEEPLYIGALKSNIGHLEGASGIAGFIKAIMVLERGIIPPNANFERLNPKIDSDFLNIKFPLINTPWPNTGLRRASVNSFGFGGANSHVVLDDAYNFLRLHGLTAKNSTVQQPPSLEALYCSSRLSSLPAEPSRTGQKATSEAASDSRPKLLVWSAADKGGLARLERVYNRHFMELSPGSTDVSAYLDNLSYTLAIRRSSLSWKSFAVVNSISELHSLGVSLSTPIRSTNNLSIGYIFTGQGAQFNGMGRELLVYPTFKNTLQRAEFCLRNLGCQWSLLDELLQAKKTSNIDDPEYSQPICTVLQIALVELLRSFNIMPSAVIGHSSGEIAAAYCLGSLSLQSACKLAYFRGKLAAKLAKSSRHRGAMMSIGLAAAEVYPYIQEINSAFKDSGITVACINSPKNVTVSGNEAQIDALKILLDDRTFTRKLQVGVAYHSPHMNDIASEYLASIKNLETGEPFQEKLIMISSVTGKSISTDELCQGEYWVNNMISQVKFLQALKVLSYQTTRNSKKKLGEGHRNAIVIHDLLEIGPHSTLQWPIRDTLKTTARGNEISYHSVLIRNMSALDTTLHTAGHLHCLGYPVNLTNVNRVETKRAEANDTMTLTNLPEYPFDHSQTFWHESRLNTGFRLRKYPRLDLLGTPALDWNPLEARWRKFINTSETPWVGDHKINGSIIYPAAGMLVMAIEGTLQLADQDRHIMAYCIKDVTFHKPLIIPSSQNSAETQLYIHSTKDFTEKSSAWSEFRLCVFEDGHWTENCRGVIQVEYEKPPTELDDNEVAEKLSYYTQLYENGIEACDQAVDSRHMYKHLQNMGLDYGPTFQSLQGLACNNRGEAIAEIGSSQYSTHEPSNQAQSYVIHPTTLDAVAQLVYVALTNGARDTIPTTIPTRICKFWISSSGLSHSISASTQVYTKSIFRGFRGTQSSLFALNKETGNLLMTISGLETTTVADGVSISQVPSPQNLCYHLEWKPDVDLLDQKQTQAYCKTARPKEVSPVEYYHDLDFTLFIFISKTLDALKEGESSKLKWYYKEHIQWMRSQMEKFERGELIPAVSQEWKALLQDVNYQNVLCHRLESTAIEGKLLVDIGRNLLKILQGDVDPLALYDSEHIRNYYVKVNTSATCLRSFFRYLDVMSHKNPGLKVLQIGAGVVGPVAPLLSSVVDNEGELQTLRFVQYDYTDISPAFLETAEKLYKDFKPKVRFIRLNDDHDFQKLVVDVEKYDLIIAGSGLRATQNIDKMMQNIRSLLKPGGKIALFEVTDNVTRAGFAFGLLPGWWPKPEDNQSWGPCISTKVWHTVLERNGFSGTDLVIPDYQDARCHEISIMISTALDLAPKPPKVPKTLIIVTDYWIQQGVAQRLQNSLISKGNPQVDILFLQDSGSTQDISKNICIFLVELGRPFLQNLDAEMFLKLQSILTSAPGVLWVTSGGGNLLESPAFRMIDGLARVLRTEQNGVVFVTLALEHTELIQERQIEHIIRVFESGVSQLMGGCELEYMERDGILHINRMIEASDLNSDLDAEIKPRQSKIQEFGAGPPLKLSVATSGLLDSLQFLEDKECMKSLAAHEVLIELKATGVSFMDCLTVLGQINQTTLGGECAGVVIQSGAECDLKPGDRVCGCSLDTFKTYVRCNAQLVVKIPSNLSFVEAAALPVIFSTSYHALIELARLQSGEKVLIHSGSGGTGQSAIQIARYVGADIYVTVGSETKKKLVMDLYDIPDDHIFNSRSTAFAEKIMQMTQNRGVDVILNSLSDEALVASWECIASFGRFIEIGKKDIHSHTKLSMFPFARNVSFFAIDLAAMIRERPLVLRKSLQAVMALMEYKKLFIPQPLHIYSVSEIEEAFRYMQTGKNTGKSVVKIEKKDLVLTVLDTKPTYHFDANATYLIAGGLGGLGRSIARWMASRGARNLILLSRFGPRLEAAHTLIQELMTQSVHVEAPACDVTSDISLSNILIRCAETMPPIKGCIQATMVLKDSVFETMTFEEWTGTTEAKVQGSWNLHALLPPRMDFFIFLSSVSGVIGSGGQANYAAGNTYMDALAHYRNAKGEKAISLDLGWMESEGVVAENELLQRGFAAVGFLMPISQGKFLALLEHYCNPTLKFPTPLTCQNVVGIENRAAMHAKGIDEDPYWMQRPTFRALCHTKSSKDLASGDFKNVVDYAALLGGASSLFDAGEIVLKGLVHKLAKALSTPLEDIDTSKPLHAYGVDSLLAVELRNWFASVLGADVAVFDLMGGSNLAAVSMTVAGKSRFLPDFGDEEH